MAKLSASKLKAITRLTDNKALNALEKINKLAIPASVLNNMSKTTNAILKVGLQQSAVLDRADINNTFSQMAKLHAPVLNISKQIGLFAMQNRADINNTFSQIAKLHAPVLNISKYIGLFAMQNRADINNTFSQMAKLHAPILNISKQIGLFEKNESVFNKTMLLFHKNLTNNLSDKSWKGLFQNLENITADINLSNVKIESQGDTLVINDELITEESINDFTERLADSKENIVAVWTAIPKSLKIFLAFLLSIYFSWFATGLFGEMPENNIFHYKFYSNMLFSKPTIIQQKLIKQIKLKQTITPQYIVNRQIMPVHLYANRKSPVVSYLFCGNEVKIIKSIKKKRWLLVEWVCDGEKETGWVLGRYILKTSSKKTVKIKEKN